MKGSGTLGGDPELSRRHARIQRLSDDRLTVEDLGSTNGTFVNGTRIFAATLLHEGDSVELGATKLTVLPDRPPDGAVAATPASAAPPERATPTSTPPPAATPERATPPATPEPATPTERRPALRVVAGFAPGALVHVGDGVMLGRSGPGAKAFGADSTISEEHAYVSPTGDQRLLVEDLGSESGTFVGNAQIHAPTLVSTGERLRLGGSTLEVVSAAGGPGPAGVAVGGKLGGVRQVPEGLFARIAMRAPVTLKDVLPVFLLSVGWAFALNLLIRTLAIESFGVEEDLHSLVLWQLLLATFFPVAGNSFGFYMTFRRPNHRSVTRYLIPTLSLPILFTVLNLVVSDSWGAKEVAVTVAVTILPGIVSAPLMFRLRSRVARERVGALRPARR